MTVAYQLDGASRLSRQNRVGKGDAFGEIAGGAPWPCSIQGRVQALGVAGRRAEQLGVLSQQDDRHLLAGLQLAGNRPGPVDRGQETARLHVRRLHAR